MSNKKLQVRVLQCLLATSLCSTGVMIPDGALSIAVAKSVKLPSVTLQPGVTAELSNVLLLKKGTGNVVTFTLKITNNSSKELQFVNYWVKVRSRTGAQFTTNIASDQAQIDKIAPKSTQEILMYSKISSNLNVQDLIFEFVRWDFSQADFQLKLGKVAIPAGYSATTKSTEFPYVPSISKGIKANVKKLDIVKKTDEAKATVIFQLQNNGTTSVQLKQYKYYIQTVEGYLYPLTMVDPKENAVTILPKFRKQLKLEGVLPVDVNKANMTLVLTEEDQQSKLELLIAKFSLPQPSKIQNNTVVPYQAVKQVEINEVPFETSVLSWTRNKTNEKYRTNITFRFANKGLKSVALPKYEFTLKTSDGYEYPVVSSNLDANVTVNPKTNKEIKLEFSVPTEVNASNWTLLLHEPKEGDSSEKGNFIAEYRLSEQESPTLSLGKPYVYTNGNGSYEIKLESVQRLPWNDEDIVTIQTSITNKEKSTNLPLLPLSGKFVLDNSVEVPFQMISKDQLLALKPNETSKVELYAKIPYTYNYTNMKVVLNEKISDQENKGIAEFTINSTYNKLPVIEFGKTASIEGAGRQASIGVRDAIVYSGNESDFFTILVDVKNLETRFSEVPNLYGYLKTNDGYIFPVTISEIKEKISPLGKAVLFLSTPLPKDINYSNLKLILGESVKDGALATSGPGDAYINAAEYQLGYSDNNIDKSSFQNINVFPYKLSLNNIYATIKDLNTFSFSFNYKLEKEALNQVGRDQFKIKFEIKDKKTNFEFSKEVTLGGTAAEDLSIGSNTQEYTVPNTELRVNYQNLDNYTFKIYETYQGYNRLIAERNLSWFVTNSY